MSHPGSPIAFESLVEDYDAARPTYPAALYDLLPAFGGRRLLELGAGTGLGTRGLLERDAWVVSTDRGPRMLGRLHRTHPQVPVAVAGAEALPFAGASFDGVCGAQMWHWVDVPEAAAEVARVLRPGGWLALWWNEVDPAAGSAYERVWQEQQARLEAGSGGYTRTYRSRDHTAELTATGRFTSVEERSCRWERVLDVELYERWLRSKSFVQAVGDVEGFVAAERASLLAAFPDGRVVEPFAVRLWLAHL